MEYEFTSHAEERMRERMISKKFVFTALKNPTKVSYDNQGGRREGC